MAGTPKVSYPQVICVAHLRRSLKPRAVVAFVCFRNSIRTGHKKLTSYDARRTKYKASTVERSCVLSHPTRYRCFW